MFPVVGIVDEVIKEEYTARGNVLVKQCQSINGTCNSIQLIAPV